MNWPNRASVQRAHLPRALQLHLGDRRLQQRAHRLHFMHHGHGHDGGGRPGQGGDGLMGHGQAAQQVFGGFDQGVFEVVG